MTLVNDTKRTTQMTDWRSQKRQARVTLIDVQNAINQLTFQGIQNPSLRAIRSEIGRGSLDKINALKKQLNDKSSLIEDNKKDNLVGIKDNLKDVFKNEMTTHLKDVYRRLDNIEGQLSLNLEDPVYLETDTTLSELRQMWLDAVSKCQVLESKIHGEKAKAQVKSEASEKKVADLESKLESIQKEAQTNIDSLTQKLGEAKREIQRQSTEYNNLHQKYMALKTDIFDGNAPVKSATRNPLTLNGEAEAEYIIDTDKAKEKVIELITDVTHYASKFIKFLMFHIRLFTFNPFGVSFNPEGVKCE